MQLTHRAISLLRGNRVALPVDRTSISMRRAIGLMTLRKVTAGMNTFLSGKVLQERFHRHLKLPGDFFPAEHRDWLEARLAGRSYLVGGRLTEADIRLFTTLIRFGSGHYGHFKCNLRRLVDYPRLWDYTRSLFQHPKDGHTHDTWGSIQASMALLARSAIADPPAEAGQGPELSN